MECHFPPLAQKDITLNSETAGTVAKTNSKKAGSQKGIYAVILGGPDLSTGKNAIDRTSRI